MRISRERAYWRERLEALESRSASLALTPRPELSDGSILVDEFRVRAYDGVRLWGVRARSRFGSTGIRVRVVGPSELPCIDRRVVESGTAELILQATPGRKLEDRVLDVLRVRQVALESLSGPCRIELGGACGERTPDEFLIVSQLLAELVEDERAGEADGWASPPQA